jgi:sec-independent protein translocase protein TatA
MPFRMGPVELILVLLIVLMVFGVGKLTNVGSAMGKAVREFRQSQSDSDDEKSSKSKKRD